MFLKIRNVRAHVFFTYRDTPPVFVDNSFWASGAIGIPKTFMGLVEENLKGTRKPYFSMIVDIMGTRVGDIAFLYEQEVGSHILDRVIDDGVIKWL